MTIKFIPVKCPECGADLQIKEGTNQCFCNYCGRKIMIKDSNEYVIRKVDEARIKESDNEAKVRLKELEMEQQKAQNRRNSILIFAAIEIVLIIIGIIGLATGSKLQLALMMAMTFGALGSIYFDKNK